LSWALPECFAICTPRTLVGPRDRDGAALERSAPGTQTS